MSQLHAMKKEKEAGGPGLLKSIFKHKSTFNPRKSTASQGPDPLKGGKGVKSQKSQMHKNTVKAMKARARGDKVRDR